MVVKNYKPNINSEGIELNKEKQFIDFSETKQTKQSRLLTAKLAKSNIFIRKLNT